MPLTCGWPKGSHEEDGFCGAPPAIAYLVSVRDVPLADSDAPGHKAVLLLCPRHAPAETSDDEPGPTVIGGRQDRAETDGAAEDIGGLDQ